MNAGTYNVTLTVTDRIGLSNSAYSVVRVRPPILATVEWKSSLLSESGFSVGNNGVYVSTSGEIARYTLQGKLLWTQRVLTPTYSSYIVGIVAAKDGLYVLEAAGGISTLQRLTFDGRLSWSRLLDGWGIMLTGSADNTGVYVLIGSTIDSLDRFDSQGNLVWAHPFLPDCLGCFSKNPYYASVGPTAIYVLGRMNNGGVCMISLHEVIPCPRFIEAIGFDGRTIWEVAQAPEGFPLFTKVSAGPGGIFLLGPSDSIYEWTNGWWRYLVGFVPPVYNAAISAGPSGGVYATGNVGSSSFVAYYDSNGNRIWYGVFRITSNGSVSMISATGKGIFVLGSSSIERISPPQVQSAS